MTDRFLRMPEVCMITGLKSSTIYKHIANGQFPKQTKLGARSSGWRESEVQQWMDERVAASNDQEAA